MILLWNGGMRRKVLGETAYYHLMSRTVAGEALFGDREREILRKMIWQVAEFSGIQVITYAVMKNHFHVLVEVPAKEVPVSDDELVRRFRRLYPAPTPWQPMRAEVLEWHLANSTLEGKGLRQELTARMHDVSWFMKTLKQRFAHWFNRSRERFGALWSERFKSVLVEGDRWALKTVAAYIDLNAVRAGIIEDPKDYRFCGYGEAMGGGRRARRALSVVERDLAGYRKTLYGVGSEFREGKAAFEREEAVRVLEKEKGTVPLSSILRCRVRYFSDGIILGSAEFVERELAKDSSRPIRGKSSHPMRGTDWNGLAVGRGLRTRLFG